MKQLCRGVIPLKDGNEFVQLNDSLKGDAHLTKATVSFFNVSFKINNSTSLKSNIINKISFLLILINSYS